MTPTPSPAAAPEARLRVALKSGETLGFTLPAELDQWRSRAEDPRFQRLITGLTVIVGSTSHVLAVPVGFHSVRAVVEVGHDASGTPASIRVAQTADEVTSSITVYLKQMPPLVRVDLRRTGRLRWSP